MKKTRMMILILILIVTSLIIPGSIPAWGQTAGLVVTAEKAQNVAANWVSLVTSQQGSWGGSKSAEAQGVTELQRSGHVIGYFCHVKPQGFIVMSLLEGLPPVQAYSETSDLDPESNEGLADLIKGKMEATLNRVVELVGPVDSVLPQDLDKILEINYSGAGVQLEKDVETFEELLQSDALATNYQSGGILLSSSWHQLAPYNNFVPNLGCDNTKYELCNFDHNAAVGCVATAGAQIMRYWDWPPYNVWPNPNVPYDWPNMPDSFTGCTWPQAQIDAVARLCHEVGIAVGMDYGCASTGGSGAYTIDMLDVYGDYFYAPDRSWGARSDYSALGWFNLLKAQFNVNRPVQYEIFAHSMVADGWRERNVGGIIVREYHMNYGWADSHNAWWPLDALYYPEGGSLDDEHIVTNISPTTALGSSLSGTYQRYYLFPYRYFDQVATGDSATFQAGQYLQFLPGITATCTSTTGGSVRFDGSSPLTTRLFTRGDTTKGIRIDNGTIKLDQNGSIVFP